MTSRWEQDTTVPRGAQYDERFERLARAGHDVHGEASFVMGYEPASVLDAGCGTGRVAIELARRGVDVVGVDLDRAMLEAACEKSPDIEWYRADLSDLLLPDGRGGVRTFDLVVAAGNVMIFLQPGTESRAISAMADHLAPGGRLVAGFQLTAGRYSIDDYDRDCAAAGLILGERFSTWSRDPWHPESGYVVSVHLAQDSADDPAPTDGDAQAGRSEGSPGWNSTTGSGSNAFGSG